MKRKNILLSICIPTYNRASYLQLCLQQFFKQLNNHQDKIEIIIGDNSSDDNTAQTVQQFISSGFALQYYRHKNNLGADANVLFCLMQASGEYVWVMGDDDLLLDDKLHLILNELISQRFSHIYLGNYWFANDYIKERPVKSNMNYNEIFANKKKYLKDINIWATFLSAHIFKRAVLKKIEAGKFIGSNLNQLQWVLTSMFSEGEALFIHGNVLACKGNNTGGYSLFQTFGPNLNTIVINLQKTGLVPPFALKILNYYFIKDFMPQFCLQYKQKKLHWFKYEPSPFIMLQPIYSKYPVYWFVLKPIDWLPVFVAKKYYFGLKLFKII